MTALTIISEGPIIGTAIDLSSDPFAEWIAPLACLSFREDSGWVHENCAQESYLSFLDAHLSKNITEQVGAIYAGGGPLNPVAAFGTPSVRPGEGGAAASGPVNPPTSFPGSPGLPGSPSLPGTPGTPVIVVDPVDPIIPVMDPPTPVPLPASGLFLLFVIIVLILPLAHCRRSSRAGQLPRVANSQARGLF